MPELSNSAAQQFWSEYQDPHVHRVIMFMEGVEDWTLEESPILQEALQQLGQELDDIANVDMNELSKQELLVALIAYAKTGLGLRLMQIIDGAKPGAASKLLVYAEEQDRNIEEPAGLFLRRNIVFERLRLLSRTFSQERMKMVLDALGGEAL